MSVQSEIRDGIAVLSLDNPPVNGLGLATRRGLVEALAPHGLSERFAHIAEQRGMFSYTGLSPLQVQRLREEFSVYMVGSGRANVAGLDASRLDQLADAIARVCVN